MVINLTSASGEHFYVESGVSVIVSSGLNVIAQSGLGVSISGQGVYISGQHVYVESGVYTTALNLGYYYQQTQALYIATDASGRLLANISGTIVTVSGNHVFVESGVYIASGLNVATTQVAGASDNVILTNYTSNTLGVKFIDGKPRVSATPYTYDISEGNISGHISWSKIGFATVGTTEQDMWFPNSGAYVFPTSGIQMMLKSTAVGDRLTAPLGSGAWSVNLYYLDSGYIPKSESITLNGTSGVNTVATDIYRVQNMRVSAVGTNGKPYGNLLLTDTAGARIYGYISSGQTRMRQCIWTVPASSTLYVTQVRIGANTTAGKMTKFTTRANFDDKSLAYTSGFMIAYNEFMTVDTPFTLDLNPPTKLPQKTDLKVVQIGEAAGTAVCSLRGWYE